MKIKNFVKKSFIGFCLFLGVIFLPVVLLPTPTDKTSQETDKTSNDNVAPAVAEADKKDDDDFKPPENFVLASEIETRYRKYYFDPSSVKITINKDTLKEWSQDWLIYDKHSKKTFKVNYNFCWDDPEDVTRIIDKITAVKFDNILGWFFMKSWESAFHEEYSGKMVDIYITYPEQDTWVLNWEGVDYFVKAHSLNYAVGNPIVINDFSYDVAYNGEIHKFNFDSRGGTILKIDGVNYGYGYYGAETSKGQFVHEIFNAICSKVIRQYIKENLSIQARTFVEEKGEKKK